MNKPNTWAFLPEDMTKQFPVGGIIHPYGGARGVVIGYEMKILYKSEPAWWVVIAHLNDKGLATPSAFPRSKTSKVLGVIEADTLQELYDKVFWECKEYKGRN